MSHSEIQELKEELKQHREILTDIRIHVAKAGQVADQVQKNVKHINDIEKKIVKHDTVLKIIGSFSFLSVTTIGIILNFIK